MGFSFPSWQLLKQVEAASPTNFITVLLNKKPKDWDDFGFPSSDTVRRAQLQAIFRRLQGIVGSMSRIPSFRRRFRNLIKVLHVQTIQMGTSETVQELEMVARAQQRVGMEKTSKRKQQTQHEKVPTLLM